VASWARVPPQFRRARCSPFRRLRGPHSCACMWDKSALSVCNFCAVFAVRNLRTEKAHARGCGCSLHGCAFARALPPFKKGTQSLIILASSGPQGSASKVIAQMISRPPSWGSPRTLKSINSSPGARPMHSRGLVFLAFGVGTPITITQNHTWQGVGA